MDFFKSPTTNYVEHFKQTYGWIPKFMEIVSLLEGKTIHVDDPDSKDYQNIHFNNLSSFGHLNKDNIIKFSSSEGPFFMDMGECKQLLETGSFLGFGGRKCSVDFPTSNWQDWSSRVITRFSEVFEDAIKFRERIKFFASPTGVHGRYGQMSLNEIIITKDNVNLEYFDHDTEEKFTISYVDYYNQLDLNKLKNCFKRSLSQYAQTSPLFLLGGHDLEMEKIKEILTKKRIEYLDAGLNWGANVSSYKDTFINQPGREIFGIELSQDKLDFSLPISKYHLIDHHNNYAGKQSSIQQVIEIIGYKPESEKESREIELISANDSGYIPAMKAIGATNEEIADIRARDRAAQGVTPEEERLAAEAISRASINKSLAVVNPDSVLSKFSPITDALFGTTNIIIYTEHELCYYGPIAHKLGEESFSGLVSEGKAYYGGAEQSGYFGVSYDGIPAEQIRNMANSIKRDCLKAINKENSEEQLNKVFSNKHAQENKNGINPPKR